MLPLLSTEIETPTSFLKLYSFPDEELLNNCIKEVENNKLFYSNLILAALGVAFGYQLLKLYE